MQRLIATPFDRTLHLKDYILLTKPRIIALLVMTAYCAMVVASRHWPSSGQTFNTLGGLSLSIGGAHAVNMWYDRDIDQKMERTRTRPIPSGRMAPANALSFGLFLEIVSFVWLNLTVNQLAAWTSLGGFLFYVFIYTIGLKRRSPQNIVIGGAAGSFPPVVGWVAVIPHLSWAPDLMFLTIFLWTPPHFWALALYKQEDYRRADIPMLPVVKGDVATIRQMILYATLLVPASLAIYGVAPWVGSLYLVFASLLGTLFWLATFALRGSHPRIKPQQVFLASLLYMAGLFMAMTGGTLLH